MSTTQEPDYKGIAKQMAEGAYPRKMWPEGTLDEVRRQRKGYTSCMEAKLRQDWETIRLLNKLLDMLVNQRTCDPSPDSDAPSEFEEEVAGMLLTLQAQFQ